ncbi:MAG: toxin-antitoxin system HicB family antitoxin [Gammaproteobacteria bacterium]|nr:toxin-antitoxin system HicB family antitoxin [Gammaproteobacteria bacterium]MDE0285947.1 toxin-antitoxin system HicB family antitoxin [Gammaproteobacteria bacterium]MDE0512738.1 toxin-antitoxin system HicB family antitoxin [Gammaproteobacteria bacterium]
MSTLSLRLPDSLHEQVKALARQDGISINQFISSAVAEKMSALMTEEYLSARAKAGNEGDFFNALSRVPATDPFEQDVL